MDARRERGRIGGPEREETGKERRRAAGEEGREENGGGLQENGKSRPHHTKLSHIMQNSHTLYKAVRR